MSMTDPDVERIQYTIIQALDDYRFEIRRKYHEAHMENASHEDKAYLKGQMLGLTQAINIVKTGTADPIEEE